jgi:hypothetical protein
VARSNLRNASFYAALKNFPEAMRWADKAVVQAPGKVSAYAARAEIKLQVKSDAAILHSVESDIRQIKKLAEETKGARPHSGLLAKLRVRFELAKGNLGTAMKELESVPRGNHKLRKKLSLEIANDAISRSEKNPEIIDFANKTLAAK